MNAAYHDPEVKLDSASRAARVKFTIRNDSRETWRAAEGFGVGYHLFDAETGTLIVDGARMPPEQEVRPGESALVQLEFQLPPEDGRYRVLLSPMREGDCWYYDRGWPFLLLEGETREGVGSLARIRVATERTLRRERILRAAGRAFTYPLLTMWRNRGLIRTMVRRDILGRYRGSFAGIFWTVINPLLLMLTYFFVFGIVLRARFPGDESRSGFALNFLAGMLPWLAFSEAAGRSPSVLVEHRNFIKKLVFAVETLPLNLVAAGLVSEFFAVLVFCAFLAAFGVFARDLGQIIGFLLTLWFFLTPICYPEASLPAEFLPVFSKNPMYVLVRGYRAIFLGNHAPDFGPLWKLWLLAGAVFVLGHAWFYKLRKSFPDIV